MATSATVAYVPLRTDLANLPADLVGMLFNSNTPVQSIVVELTLAAGLRSQTKVYLGWSGLTSAAPGALEVDPTFAQNVHLPHGAKVAVSVHANAPLAHTVHLEPATTADWEIVETQAAYIESRMINQVRAVSLAHPITLYPSSTAIACLRVTKIEPPPSGLYARLSPDSEVVIAPKQRRTSSVGSSIATGAVSVTGEASKKRHAPRRADAVVTRANAYPFGTAGPGADPATRQLVLFGSILALPELSRVLVSVVRPAAFESAKEGGRDGTGASSAPATSDGVETPTEGLTNTNSGSTTVPDVLAGGEVALVPARAVAAELRYVPGGGPPVLSYGLAAALGVPANVGVIIRVAPMPSTGSGSGSNAGGQTILHPYTTSTAPGSLKLGANAAALSQQAARDVQVELDLASVGNGLVVPPAPGLPAGGIFEAPFEYGTLGKLILGSEVPISESQVIPAVDALDPPPLRPIVGREAVLDRATAALLSRAGTLVYGSRGAGKTVTVAAVAQRLRQQLVRPVWFSASAHADKPVPQVREALQRAFLEASWHAPSVLIVEDLDALMPAEQEHSDSSRSAQLAEIFRTQAGMASAARPVAVLASAQSKEALHALLLSSHVLDELVHIKSPDKAVREAVLGAAMASLGLRGDAEFDLLDVVGETEGYQPGDLWVLAERVAAGVALSEHYRVLDLVKNEIEDEKADRETIATTAGGDLSHDGLSGNPIAITNGTDDGLSNSMIQPKKLQSAAATAAPAVVTSAMFTSAAADYTPASLRGVKLEKPAVSWKEIGGLRDVKRTILETLEWPTKYAPIFKQSPLRLRSGLLLYGYPGCGKTLLASAIAAQTGLNFISVKGPEILNKYIGASEQSVRDLFDRAQAAKPCVLFFDEFDSIAPKRGHDSTGVTDRVVNQMLTEMDGAEGLDGVYVLAATSRPDLIDSALLRPGRLDKSLLCDMPAREDRIEIIAAAQAKMSLAEDVSVDAIADQTEGFSGADLQAIMTNAYLDAIHSVVDRAAADASATEGGQGNSRTDLDVFVIQGSMPVDVDSIKNYVAPHDDAIRVGAAGAGPASLTGKVSVTAANLAKALDTTKPSISRKELAKLRRIYQQFVADRDGQMPPGTSSNEVGARVTLS